MKLETRDLKRAVTALKKIKAEKNLPITENILFQSSWKGCKLTYGNFNTQISTFITNEGEGKFLFNLKTLEGILKNYKGKIISFMDTGIIKVEGDDFLYAFSKEDHTDYPQIKETYTDSVFLELNKAYKALDFVCKDRMRPAMQGVFFDLENGKICATDAHKLYLSDVSVNKDSFIIPSEPLLAFKRLKEDFVQIFYNKESFKIDGKKYTIEGRLINERFPAYKNVIPVNNDKKFTLNTKEFLNALEQSQTVNDVVELTFSDDFVNIVSRDLDMNTEFDKMVHAVSTGGNFKIKYNSKIFIPILKNISNGVFTLECSAYNRAATIKSNNDLFLIMPIL